MSDQVLILYSLDATIATPISLKWIFLCYFNTNSVNIILNLFNFEQKRRRRSKKNQLCIQIQTMHKKKHLHYANIIGAKKLLRRRFFFLDVLCCVCIQFAILLVSPFVHCILLRLRLCLLSILCILRAFEFQILFSFHRIPPPLLVIGNTVAPNVKLLFFLLKFFSSRSVDRHLDAVRV